MLTTRPVQHFSNDLDKSFSIDDYLDLVVWYEPMGQMHGFQLCYDRYGRQRAVTWTANGGFSHSLVQLNGSSGLGAGMSPVLQTCDDFPWRDVLREFEVRTPELDPVVRRLVQCNR